MKSKVLFIMFLLGLTSIASHAQRGVRIGYIDTEYILQNVPEYQEASNQLDQKVQQWKADIEQRLGVIDTKKKQLNNERILLTKELYEERLEDISFEEAEILDYQQKRFGPSGDLMIQKQQLMQPIQDQIFAAVQEIAGNKKYDFIFDKSADVVMLYSAERYDISELIIRSITRSSKRTQANTREERKAANEEDVVPEINEELEAREKAIEEKQSARQKLIEERREAQQKRRDSLKDAAEARRQKILDEREAAKTDRDSAQGGTQDRKSDVSKEPTDDAKDKTPDSEKTPEQIAEEKRQAKLKDREERKKALEERKQKILEARKKAKEEREAQKKENDSVPENN
ncbi:OmpH family outer membrane protein [Sediminibacter sp. Hel_I_10]|uniref:OmpH family outer membrane protein n=1 Tax=Sediminibacter sp. Hel_I_10 TaxID=1392490 RepID=UPI00047DB7E2|nr:OmpH family outer membrane protein [Sediminibacter sp. Hel_I_10]